MEIVHFPLKFGRRSDDFTLNIWGMFGLQTREIQFSLNGSEFSAVRQESPRVHRNTFAIELLEKDCKKGENRILIEALEKSGNVRRIERAFYYDSNSPELPLYMEWDAELDSADGLWETIKENEQTFVRPVPNTEGYDRVVIVAPAFSGGRRVSTRIAFHGSLPYKPFGFGIAALWGGRPDYQGTSPRRGWCFSISNYYSGHSGIGMEFSHTDGRDEPAWVGVYRGAGVSPGDVFDIVVEAWPVSDSVGKHRAYYQRARWSLVGGETGPWMQLDDSQGASLPCRDYGVAVMAHNCQINCGPVLVEPLPYRPG